MAESREVWFTGFEAGAPVDMYTASAHFSSDGGARSGEYYFRGQQLTSGTVQASFQPHAHSISAVTEKIFVRSQYALRVFTHPSTNRFLVRQLPSTLTGGSPNAGAWLAGGEVFPRVHGDNGETGIVLPDDGQWRLLRFEMEFFFDNVGSSASTVISRIWLLDAETGAHIGGSEYPRSVQIPTDRRFVGSNGANIRLGDTLTSGTPHHIDYDDWWIGIGAGEGDSSVPWPSGTRAARVPVSGTGAETDFSGDWESVVSTPVAASTSEEMAASAIGDRATFVHPSASALRLGVIEGLNVHVNTRRVSGSGVDRLIVGDTTVDQHVASSTAYRVTPSTASKGFGIVVYEPGSPISHSSFDDMEFGCESAADDTRLGGVIAEAWTESSQIPFSSGFVSFPVAWMECWLKGSS